MAPGDAKRIEYTLKLEMARKLLSEVTEDMESNSVDFNLSGDNQASKAVDTAWGELASAIQIVSNGRLTEF